jgi:alkaline phosphatase D
MTHHYLICSGRIRSGRIGLVGLLVTLLLVAAGCRRADDGARLALAEAVPPTGFVWSGGLTPRSVEVVAGLWSADSVRLVVQPEAEGVPALASEPFTVSNQGRIVRATLQGLTPGTRYTYAFTSGEGRLREGTFRTPEDGPFSFNIALAGCSLTGSDRPVFDAIRATEPLFFLHLGDLFYEDIAVNSPGFFRRAFGRVLRSDSQSALYRSTPLVYIWDDHDYGPNNSDRIAPAREAVREVYETIVPHYPLRDGPIYQAFTVGRVRFIVTDLRSARDPVADVPGDRRTVMGVEQRSWFERQLLAAKDRYAMIVWVSTVPWIGPPSPTADHWGGFPEERQEIADLVKENGIDQLVIVGGDAHMVAIDDGTNSDYATGGGAPIPVIQAAPLDQTGSRKGGPFSEGAYPNPSVLPPHPGQWVEMTVQDEGGSEICAEWTGYRTDSDSPDTEEIVSWGRCFDAPPRPEPARSVAPPDSTVLDAVLGPEPPAVAIEVVR